MINNKLSISENRYQKFLFVLEFNSNFQTYCALLAKDKCDYTDSSNYEFSPEMSNFNLRLFFRSDI